MNTGRIILAQTLALSLLAWASTVNAAQKLKDADCLACHSDSTLTQDVNGKTVNLFVDENKLKHSIHGGMFACVDCHKDVKSLVHEARPAEVTCASATDAQLAYSHSTHAIARKTGAARPDARIAMVARTRFWPPTIQSRP